ncbi:MAG TPA: MoaD/ThiS family protein [Pseudonocardiaceae bacterium]|jgi:molybdopterin converting factor small subunit|nr:MoaD/ThiS family protein [Pseudonocardiaceae bacterium]
MNSGKTTLTTTDGTQATVVLVRYFAGARAAAGVAEEEVALTAHPATVGAVLDAVRGRHAPALHRVLSSCSFLLNGVAVHDGTAPLPVAAQPAELDVLPPFAGG